MAAAALPSRSELVERHLGLARSVARRHAGRGEPLDDLVQVGCVALLHAADRFDPSRAVPFEAYAALTIDGEIRRHLRDAAAPVRIPRDRVAEAQPAAELPDDLPSAAPDPLAAADARADLRRAVSRLSQRERLALYLRYVADLPRGDVAARLGLSEVQTSRVVSGALRKCGEALAAGG